MFLIRLLIDKTACYALVILTYLGVVSTNIVNMRNTVTALYRYSTVYECIHPVPFFVLLTFAQVLPGSRVQIVECMDDR